MTAYRDRGGTWRYHLMFRGRRYTKRGFPTKRAATTAAEVKRSELERGLSGAYPTFLELVKAYLRESARTNSDAWVKQKHTKLSKWFGPWANLPPDRITPAHVLERLQAIEASGNGPRSVNEYRKILHAVFAFSVDLGALARNPVQKIGKAQEPEDPKDPIATADLRKLLIAAPLWLRRFLVVQATTGARWIQIARMKRDEVKIEGPVRYVVLRSRKARRERLHQQHLTEPAAAAIAAQLGEHSSQWVFPGPRGRLVYNSSLKALQAACKRAGIGRSSFHRVRYWAGSALVGAGFSNRVVGKFLGHTQTSTTERYMYVEDELMTRVAKHLSESIGEVDLAAGATSGATSTDASGN